MPKDYTELTVNEKINSKVAANRQLEKRRTFENENTYSFLFSQYDSIHESIYSTPHNNQKQNARKRDSIGF